MDIVNTGQSRLTAFGCQNGYVRCCKVDSNSNCKMIMMILSFKVSPINLLHNYKSGINTFSAIERADLLCLHVVVVYMF